MTNPGPQRGWKTRREKAAARDYNAPDADRAAIRKARQAMYAEARQRDAKAALEAAKAQASARCSCPVCDGAPVDVALAARVITAMAKLPSHVPNDPAVVAALETVVSLGRDLDRFSIYREAHAGLHVPHRVYAAAPAAETVTPEPATINPKPEPVVPSRPRRRTIAELAARQGDDLESVDE